MTGLSLSVESMGNVSFGTLARRLKKAGFSGVELGAHVQLGRAARLWKEAASELPEVIAVHGRNGTNAVDPDPLVRKRCIARERARILRCAPFAPCPYVLHYVNRHQDPAYGERMRAFVAALLPAAERAGVVLAVETAPWKPQQFDRHPDAREIADFVRSFHSDFVGLTMDVNHSNLHEDILAAIRACRGVLSHVHLSDNHGVCEEHLLPGQGVLDFRAVWKALRENGYTGMANFEVLLSLLPLRTAGLHAAAEEWKKSLSL